MLLSSGLHTWPDQKMERRTKIDINLGTFDQLKTLVGIGDTFAKRIVEGRPYYTIEELLKRNILPQITYDKMKEFITARPQ